MRKNPVNEIINRIIWTDGNGKVYFLDRKGNLSLKEIDVKDIEKLGSNFIFLKNGDMIPYHRVRRIISNGIELYKR